MKIVKFAMMVVAAMAIALAVTFPWVTALVVITWALMGISISLIDRNCDNGRKGMAWSILDTANVVVSAIAGPLWALTLRSNQKKL